MKKILALAACAALSLGSALTLSGCAGLTGNSSALLATKADLGVDSLFSLYVNGTEAWLKASPRTPAQAATARTLLGQARTACLAADAAFAVGDSATAAQKVGAFENLLVQLAAFTAQAAPDFSAVKVAPAPSVPPATVTPST